MSPLTSRHITHVRRTLLAAMAGAALIAAAPAPASAHNTIALQFQKQCNDRGSCSGTLLSATGRPLPGTSVSALCPAAVDRQRRDRLLRNRDDHRAKRVVHDEPPRYQRHERHANAITVLGAVVSGSWDGVPLAGATVFIRAYGRDPLPSIRGTIWIQPPRNSD